MKPAPFEYHAPESLSDVVALLAEHGDEAKVLAGGQSLVPMLALRLTRFEHIVDLNRVDDLRGVVALERHAHDQGDDHASARSSTTPPPVRRCRCSPRPSRSSATSRSATGARSAARSPTPTPRRSCRRSRSRSTPSSRSPARAARRTRPGVRVLRRHVDHDRRRGRDPQRGALPRVDRSHRLRGRGGRAPQRRLRAHRCRRRGRGRRRRRRSRAPASRSSAWHPRPCAPRRPSRRWSAPPPTTADLDEIGRLAVTDTDPTADVHASAEYRKHVGAHLVVRALDRALGAARG